MNTTMADGAEQRLDAQIAEALFGQPGMSKMDVANRVRELRGDGPALLVDGPTGGSARLGDSLPPLPCTHYNACGDGSEPLYTSEQMRDYALSAQPQYITDAYELGMRDGQALSAQPSPGGQGDAHDIEDPCDVITRAAQKLSAAGQPRIADRLVRARTEVERLQAAYLTARQSVGVPVVAAHRYIQRYQSAEHSTWLNGDADETYVDAERQGLGRIERAYAAPPAQAVDLEQSIPLGLTPVAAALKRFDECAEDCGSEGCDIGRAWFDALTTMGLLKRTQRSPAVWTMTAEGERLLALIDGKAVVK